MATIRSGFGIGSLSEISDEGSIRVSIDLVAAARKNVRFIRVAAENDWLHHTPTIVEAIRRYEELWMPLISDCTVGSKVHTLLPPIDVEWIWFCHTLNPASYRQFCESRFSALIGKPAIFDYENEEYALNRCREIWIRRYPSEPFENESDPYADDSVITNEDIFGEVIKQRYLRTEFLKPYMSEAVYLITARQRYKGFVHLLRNKDADGCSHLVPTSDVLLMWLSHQSYPTIYAEDVKEIEVKMEKVAKVWERAKEEEAEATKKLWENEFGQPYERAGGGVALEVEGVVSVRPPLYWDFCDVDINSKYKSMTPRFLLEVSVFLKLNSKFNNEEMTHEFLRIRMLRCHKELKIDKPVSHFRSDFWQKACHLYCEFGTRGVLLELRSRGSRFFKGSSSRATTAVLWTDLLRSPGLMLAREIPQNVRAVTSITPPVQAPYLLKCVPDRVTDDSGAMISDEILRMNRYQPQAGRWLSRTVLDHVGRECFVVRIRIAGGIWRRGGEAPAIVKWQERIVEIREGSWSYVAGSIGVAPEKMVGKAAPKEESEDRKASWYLSTGDELTIQWDSSASAAGFSFDLTNPTSCNSSVKLLKGRKMQYHLPKFDFSSVSNKQEEEEEDYEEGFVTLVRFTEENPTGRATALFNWKLLLLELMPEEDAVLVLLLCVSILRTVSEIRKEDMGNLLIRRRLREPQLGVRDWGSVVLHPSPGLLPVSSIPYVQPWYWNAKTVITSDNESHAMRQPGFSYSPAEGGDNLYKRGILT